MWFWTLLFSLQTFSSLGMKSGFLAAVCQQWPRPISYVVTVIKDLWSVVGAEGDPGRRNAEIGPVLLERDPAARPLVLPNSWWEDGSRRRAAPHRPLPQIHGPFWGPRPEHGPGCFMLGRFHNILNSISQLTRIFPPLRLALELCNPIYWRFGHGGMLQYWGATWVGRWGAPERRTLSFWRRHELSQGCSHLERQCAWELGRQKGLYLLHF